MKRIFVQIFVILSLLSSLSAHTLLITDFDNEDGTMDVMGGFSTGATAQGAMLIIESLSTSEILFKKRVPASGALTIDIPKEAYTIVLDAGQGHRITKTGTIKPKDGFIEIEKKGLNINLPYYLTMSISFLFLFGSFSLAAYKRRRFIKSIA